MVTNTADARKRQERELKSLSSKLEALRIAYERYFMGLERIPPLVQREKLEREIRQTTLSSVRNSALRFRYDNLCQRLVVYRSYWNRIMRLIEEGKFKRERTSAEMSNAPKAPADASGSKEKGAKNVPREIYDAWIKGQSEVGKPSNVSYQAFRTKIERQKQAHMKKYGWKDVNYSVQVEDGRVSLRANPVEKTS